MPFFGGLLLKFLPFSTRKALLSITSAPPLRAAADTPWELRPENRHHHPQEGKGAEAHPPKTPQSPPNRPQNARPPPTPAARGPHPSPGRRGAPCSAPQPCCSAAPPSPPPYKCGPHPWAESLAGRGAACCPPNGFDVRPDGSRSLIAAVLINSATVISARGLDSAPPQCSPGDPKRAAPHAAPISPYPDQWGGYRGPEPHGCGAITPGSGTCRKAAALFDKGELKAHPRAAGTYGERSA